jgi:hypothetical protein
VLHELDGRVLLVDEREVKELTARADPRVKVLVPELERQPEPRGVEAGRYGPVGGTQLRNHA